MLAATKSNLLDELKITQAKHKLWNNPLLKACGAGKLLFEDFQFLFSQYYLYSKNFTRFLAALMANCDSDFYRSKLSENLWEEGGGANIEERHAEIFREFLKEHLHVGSLDKIVFEHYSEHFVEQYFNICFQYKASEASAALSLGTEAIVPRLYTIFRSGLEKAGLTGQALRFFDLHIECDDDHAHTLEEMMLSYSKEDDWFTRCEQAIITVLDLRDQFFTDIYNSLRYKTGLEKLIASARAVSTSLTTPIASSLLCDTNFSGNLLYKNNHAKEKIAFEVERLPFASEILDPRLVAIPVGYTNELHRHAHETVFLILDGEGEVLVGDKKIPVQSNNIVFVPRWLPHQTRNTGNSELRFFAITDYGFTKCFPENTENVYRMNHENAKRTQQ